MSISINYKKPSARELALQARHVQSLTTLKRQFPKRKFSRKEIETMTGIDEETLASVENRALAKMRRGFAGSPLAKVFREFMETPRVVPEEHLVYAA